MQLVPPATGDVSVKQSDDAVFRNRDKLLYDHHVFNLRVPLAPAAGEYGRAILNNPADSGVTVIIDRIFVVADATVDILPNWGTTVSGTLWGNGRPASSRTTLAKAELYYETPTTKYTGYMWKVRAVANETLVIGDGSFFLLEPGDNFYLAFQTDAVSAEVSYFWREHAVT